MTAAFHSNPDSSDPLSAREQRILASIENDLAGTDPGLAKAMADDGWTRIWSSPLGHLTPRGVLTGTVLLLAPGALMPASWWAVVGLLVVFVGLPWLVLGVTRRGGAP
jgi:hypothetical protein